MSVEIHFNSEISYIYADVFPYKKARIQKI